jgi:hypothetical protein
MALVLRASIWHVEKLISPSNGDILAVSNVVKWYIELYVLRPGVGDIIVKKYGVCQQYEALSKWRGANIRPLSV